MIPAFKNMVAYAVGKVNKRNHRGCDSFYLVKKYSLKNCCYAIPSIVRITKTINAAIPPRAFVVVKNFNPCFALNP